MTKAEIFIEKLYGWIAVVCSLLGIFVSILDFVSQDINQGPFRWLKGAQPLTLLLVSLIAIGLGLERLTRFLRWDQKITAIENLIRQNGIELSGLSKHLETKDSVKTLIGEKQVYEEGIHLIGLAKRNIRATSLGDGPPSSPSELSEAYIKTLQESDNRGRPVRLDIVLGADSDYRVTTSRKEQLLKRWELFQKNNVDSYIHYHLVITVVGLELLIIDNAHMIISVPYHGGVEGFKYGLLFFNAPEIVDEFADWFDNVLREKARALKSLESLEVLSS